MKTFIAKNPKQLDLCLRLMYSEGVDFKVRVVQTMKFKIVYQIDAWIDGDKANELERKYMILIS